MHNFAHSHLKDSQQHTPTGSVSQCFSTHAYRAHFLGNFHSNLRSQPIICIGCLLMIT